MPLHLTLPPPRRTFQVLVAISAVLVVAGIASDLAGRGTDSELLGLRRLTDVDDESSIPTWWNTTLWLIAAVVHALIAVAVGRDRAAEAAEVDGPVPSRRAVIMRRWGWWLVAELCLVLSIDEAAMIHELPIDRLRDVLGADGWLREAWVIPGAVSCLAVVALFWPWLKSLAPEDRTGYLLAGAVFVSGSIGVEILGAAIEGRWDDDGLAYYLSVSVEELMEMAGVSLAIAVALRIAHRRIGAFEIVVRDPGASAGAGPPGDDQALHPRAG